MERNRMGPKVEETTQEKLGRLKKWILAEHTDIAPPLIYTKVGKTILKGMESVDEIPVYVVLVEKIDCDNDGKEISRGNFIMRYLFDRDRIKSLETYEGEKRIKARRRRRR